MQDLLSKVPRPGNKKAILLAESITNNPSLIRIPVIPDADSIMNNCFFNVKNKIERDGGEIVYGWQIWERGLFTEAGFHAIWKNVSTLIDITPKEEKEILFFEDKSKVFEGFNVDNVRKNYTGNPLVDDFIKVHEICFMIENFGENRFLHNPLEPVALELPEPLIEIRNNARERLIPELLHFIYTGNNQESPCFCGRSIPYHACHSTDIKATHKRMQIEYENSIKTQ